MPRHFAAMSAWRTGHTAAFAIVLLYPAVCAAQSFSLPGRAMRQPNAPLPSAPLSMTPTASAPKRFNTDVWASSFKTQVNRCWKKPDNINKEMIEVAFVLKLRPDGAVETVDLSKSNPTTALGMAYQASGLRAIMACQPYHLPKEYYDEWRFFVPVFAETYDR